MPIDEFLKSFTPGDDFDFEKFKADALEEAEKDRTAANAAIATRDEELSKTKTDLQKAQAAAWELYNNAPEGDADKQPQGDPDPNSLDEIKKRVFQPLNRK
jgi:hypothetical protein